MMGSQFNEKNLTLRVDCATPHPTRYADGRKCRQVLLNLLSDAGKFTPEGGHVEIRAEQQGVAAIRSFVRDTGIKEDIPR